MKSHFANEERIQKQRDKSIFGKSHFADEERLQGKKDFGQIRKQSGD